MIIPNISYLKKLHLMNENLKSIVLQSNDSNTTNSSFILHNNQDSNDSPSVTSTLDKNHGRFAELNPLLPLGILLIILSITFILVIFRRWPGLVTGTVSGFITIFAIYTLSLAVKEQNYLYM